MCEKLVGLGDVDPCGINDAGEQTPIGVVIRSRRPRPTCEACGGRVWSKPESTDGEGAADMEIWWKCLLIYGDSYR